MRKDNSSAATRSSLFDRLMRGLIAVPKDELEAEIRKDERKKVRADKPKKPRKKK